MESIFKPTMNLKFFRVSESFNESPVSEIRHEYRFDDELFCLKQQWIDQFGNTEWRLIETEF